MDGYVVIGTELDTKSFDAQIDYVEGQLQEIEDKLKKADMGFEVGDTLKLEAQYEKLINQLGVLRKKQVDLNKTDLSNVQKSIENIGSSTTNVIRKVGKWALAIFGIRTAYNAVRNSMSTLSRYNEQIKADTEYITFAFASMLEPVIERIVQLAYKLLNFINLIASSLFGVNLFANATTEAFNKTNKEANILKKTLTGFDEMNVINENGSTGAMGSLTPSLDLSSAVDPKQVEEMKSFWENIFEFWEKDWRNFFKTEDENWSIFVEGLGYTFSGLYNIVKGVLDFIIGLFEIFVGIFNGDMEKINDGWERMADGALNIIIGLLEGVLGIAQVVLGTISGLFLSIINSVINGFNTAVNWIVNKFNGLVSFFGTIKDKIFNIFSVFGAKVGEAISGAFKAVINGALSQVERILNVPIKAINSLLDVINKIPTINITRLSTFSLPRLAVGGVVNMPGRGINYGGANIGERGAEGVIPLTNSQMMAELGEAIGRYVTINANITNMMNGRVISRELQKVNNGIDFATNR